MAAPMTKHASGVLSMLFFSKSTYSAKFTACRRYARVLYRHPVEVLTTKDQKKQDENHGTISKKSHSDNYYKSTSSTSAHSASGIKKKNDFQKPALANLQYTHLNENDKSFGQAIIKAKSRKYREESKCILLEGGRLIKDAMKANMILKSLYFTNVDLLEELPLQQTDIPLYKVKQKHMKVWSDMVTPPGIMAICKIPDFSNHNSGDSDTPLFPITLICDQVREPGNMGAILRSAVAAGCHQIITTTGCVDVWDPKVLRAGAGCHFHGKILRNISWELLGNYISDSAKIHLAVTEENCKGRISKKNTVEITDMPSESFSELMDDEQDKLKVDNSLSKSKGLKMFKKVPLPTVCYHDVDYTNEQHVLVIGGETEGISDAAHKMAVDRNGGKVYIPMKSGIDSLNSAMAASILLFEMKRQLEM